MGTEGKKYSFTDMEWFSIVDVEVWITHVDGIIMCGFPSPADDYLESKIDLREELVRNPDATFVARVVGDSMSDDGIDEGDVLVVDRSVKPAHGMIAVCCLNNAFTVKRLEIRGKLVRLVGANPAFPPIEVQEGDELIIWGIVTYVIKKKG